MDSIEKGIESRKRNALINKNLVQKIRNLLDEKNITHSELAEHLGISKQAMGFYLSGMRGYIFPATFYIKMMKYIKRNESTNL